MHPLPAGSINSRLFSADRKGGKGGGGRNHRNNVCRIVFPFSTPVSALFFRILKTLVPWNDETAAEDLSRLRRPGSRVRCYVNDFLSSPDVTFRPTCLDNYSPLRDPLPAIRWFRSNQPRKLKSMRPNWLEEFFTGFSANLWQLSDVAFWIYEL